MWVNEVRNVNEAYARGLSHLIHNGERQTTRAGEVLVAPTPVVTIYQRPLERVLFDVRRDANPFFHFFESLWMLAGRNDAAPLNRYVSDFGVRFGESDGTIHGAYGHRWRQAFGFDQIEACVEKLCVNPGDRQAVIQMWDGRDEHSNDDVEFADVGCNDLNGDWKDRPCNTHVYLRVRNRGTADYPHQEQVLDLTVCCRSNDAVWGAHGANAVQFSVLQEYLAGRIGIGVGRLYQFSNNYHVYTSLLEKVGAIPGSSEGLVGGPYYSGLDTMPMGTQWGFWDEDLAAFMAWHDIEDEVRRLMHVPTFYNEWFTDVAVPMVVAHTYRKSPDTAGAWCRKIAAPDWRRAAGEWLNRRWKQ